MIKLLTTLFLALLTTQAFALSSDWQRDEAISVRLISGVDAVGDLATIPLGLEVEMAPEWHTYWRSPGAAGLPPNLDWSASQNLDTAKILYPVPRRYTAYGLETIGYHGHVVFPIDAKLHSAGQATNLTAAVNLLVCSAICVPKNFTVSLTLSAGAAKEGAEATTLNAFRNQLPNNAAQSGLIIKNITNYENKLSVDVESRYPIADTDIFIEDEANISFSAPKVKIADNKLSAKMDVTLIDALADGVQLAGMPVTLTVTNGDHALEQSAKIPAASIDTTPLPETTTNVPFWLAIILALIGGFILNLMPCVLPVLSLKILSVVSHGGGDRATVQRSFLFSAAGILSSYLALALVTILLKNLGLAFGWGVQFQQPVFLVLLVLLLVFFAANLWGLFEIPLPRFFADTVDTNYHPKLAGDFATGALATLLATPCSAPFLGTAVGFALAAGAPHIIAIFFALGLGMSVPYFVIALFPRLATALPKPGSWMLKLKHVLGAALGVTALWLLWVLAMQIPDRLAVFVGLAMLGIVLLLALAKTGISKILVRIGLADFILVAIGVTIVGSLMPHGVPSVEARWIPFNEKTITANIAEGHTVFVDVTADWCLTCKANMRFVLTQGNVAQRLFNSDIIAMQANWTSPDPAITEFLHRYGRFGVPFNIVFGPAAPDGLPLPELLTPRMVLEGVEKAAKP
jgi:suppressor for copper-sensitivity B